MADSNLSIPIKLDAFVLNPSVCDGNGDQGKIAPITQPNYALMRIENIEIQDDLMSHVDLHNASPNRKNSRMTDIGTGKTRTNRQGVYLHWMVPRLYRYGVATSTSTGGKPGEPTTAPDAGTGTDTDKDPSTPNFLQAPNRWLVIRKLDPNADTTLPKTARKYIKPISACIIESDRAWEIDEINDSSQGPRPTDQQDVVDLQVDVSPFLTSSTKLINGDPGSISFQKQAEIFIGMRQDAQEWVKTGETEARRVDLNLLNSSNHLFPDYQPHNSNVFSTLDRFQYEYIGEDGLKHVGTLTDAVADYFVIGWHSDPKNDPLTMSETANDKRIGRLQSLSMALNDEDLDKVPQEVKDWLESPNSTRVLNHGAMYGVEWHDEWAQEKTRPKIVLSDQVTDNLVNNMPISVGTTPLDAVLAYAELHRGQELEKDLFALSSLLRAQADSVEARRAGADEIQNYNFSRYSGGSRYVPLIDPKLPAEPPSPDDQDALIKLNASQCLLDSTIRELQQAQWEFFSIWWQYVTDLENAPPSVPDPKYGKMVQALGQEVSALLQVKQSQQDAVDNAKKKLSQAAKQSVLSEFAQLRDPTLFVGGVQSGWPIDYLEDLKVRLDFQITGDPNIPLPNFSDYGLDCLPEKEMQNTAASLVREFLTNDPVHVSARGEAKPEPPASDIPTYIPVYHDQKTGDGSNNGPWRDRWESTQPFFPLFLEWEADYFHIPYEDWVLKEVQVRHGVDTKFRYGLKDDTTFYPSASTDDLKSSKKGEDSYADRRTISGRILILPQPALSLKTLIDQVLTNTPQEELDKLLTPDEQEKISSHASSLPFLSSPLDGFTNHLLTTLNGNHVKPNVVIPGATRDKPVSVPQPIRDAWSSIDPSVGLTENIIRFIGKESELTPYGSHVQLADNGIPGFKPATHGQFRFTKLNIIDKFGQAACVIDPTKRTTGPPAIYPCISDYYEPQVRIDDSWKGWPNIMEQPKDEDSCEFVQIPPQINQPSRINSCFVTHDETQGATAYWRPVNEWENPIWGFLVVNYVDQGIQFFDSNGAFYREARLSAPNAKPGLNLPPKWSPFPAGSTSASTQQLDQLISQFANEDYLRSFIHMATSAIGDSTSAPSAYAQFMHAVVGRPLALVNTGWSIELSYDEKRSQSAVNSQQSLDLPYYLLSGQDRNQYHFQLKLGDEARPHDGLVGYFAAAQNPTSGSELAVDHLFTNFCDPLNVDLGSNQQPGTSTPPRISPINDKTFPSIKPHWFHPKLFASGADAAQRYAWAQNSNLQVFGAIVDPFMPINGFTGVLPIERLQLPSWTWEAAMKKMTAFFHFGPLLVTDDVPKFNKDDRITDQNYDKLAGKTLDNQVALPALSAADWSWLQPYVDENSQPDAFMALSIGKLDSRVKYTKGPYTVVEGYLQMRAPIVAAEKPPSPPSTPPQSH